MSAPADGHFPPTSWTLIGRIKSADATVAEAALEQLCAQYHYPLYCYLRRRGCDHQDAQDVLQDFLARLCRVRAFERLDEALGRLRGYLATGLSRHLALWRRGESRHQPIAAELDQLVDFDTSADRYERERFADHDTPDRVFERKWAIELLCQVIDQLAARYRERGRSAVFNVLRPVLESGGSLRGEDAPALAAQLGVSEEALRAQLARLLREFRAVMHIAVRQTVEHEGEVDAEMRYLMGLFER